MSGLTVDPGEAGRLRVFALSMTEAEAKALSDGGADAAATALGVPEVDAEHLEVFPLKNLEGLGLAGYLLEGYDAVAEDVARDKAKLGALGGWALIVGSKAFLARAITLDPDPRLTLIGTYRQEGIDWAPVPVETAAAAPYSAPQARKPMSDARISGMVAMAVLVFLAIFVTLFILLAG